MKTDYVRTFLGILSWGTVFAILWLRSFEAIHWSFSLIILMFLGLIMGVATYGSENMIKGRNDSN